MKYKIDLAVWSSENFWHFRNILKGVVLWRNKEGLGKGIVEAILGYQMCHVLERKTLLDNRFYDLQ